MTRLITLISSTLLANMALLSNARYLILPPNSTHQAAPLVESTNVTDVGPTTHTNNKRYDPDEADDDWGGFHKNVWMGHPWLRHPVCYECYTQGISPETHGNHDYSMGCSFTKMTPQLCGPLVYKFREPELPPDPTYPDPREKTAALTDPHSPEPMTTTTRHLSPRQYRDPQTLGLDDHWLAAIFDDHWKDLRWVTFVHPFIPDLEVCGVAHWHDQLTLSLDWITIRQVSTDFTRCDRAENTIDIGPPRSGKPLRGFYKPPPPQEGTHWQPYGPPPNPNAWP
ncbi:hypothetical protein PtrSN002B_004744 [Pyrenophora tritici-repentis]|nr:hypothetical protein PtrV1_09310 [Pyrenophora tritici-repentis]KAG9377065.1 hypothetical protein A1F94_012665 [Pyrenophora tritici-repentis]KAI0612629.1 hypothetical protein TUN205_03139 [Pyrenophora tritici-repentis]KAI1539208.1 hypothetical protein PtrSN001A_004675 [Pyrenophora tritici-repentis]KAI1549576.1 hypothetical protein PtrSN001C_001693 [Pyrenophora tritici-repentis]